MSRVTYFLSSNYLEFESVIKTCSRAQNRDIKRNFRFLNSTFGLKIFKILFQI